MTEALSARYDVGLFDLDGVCYLGADAIEHAPEEVTRAVDAGFKYIYVTNNAARLAGDVADQLASLGFPARAQDVLTSAHVAAAMVLERFGESAKVLVIGGAGLVAAIEEKGMTVVTSADDHPDVVVQGFSPDTNWLTLSEAALAIHAGAQFIATNLDRIIPRERGFMVGNGSLVLAVSNATGVVPDSAGKPEPEIFLKAAKAMNSARPLAIGDNLDTDIRGAVSAHIDSLHVLTGLATARQICLADPTVRPTFLCDDMRGLNEPYPDVVVDGARVTVGASTAEWNGTAFEVSRGGEPVDVAADVTLDLDTYRALAHAAWAAADAGADVATALGNVTVVR